MTDPTPFSREFNLDTDRTKEAGHVLTDRSRPAQVLLTEQGHHHQHLTRGQMTLIEALVQPDAVEVNFDPPRLKTTYRLADLP